ncbi:MAG: PAS domain S-box protein, partial [Candidatus Marinimicrobia bacterium]|nr:PAS domain S-box protein [Candidatus Neomarinimicrobiota bacterium]
MTTLLTIDDKPDNLVVIQAILHRLMPALQVISALSGEEGMKLARSEHPDVILLDIIMPGLDGYEVCRLIKSDPELKIIPVILLTAIMTGSKARVKGLELGADAFLNKPINEEELIAQIKVMLRIKSAEDALRLEKQNLEDIVAERTATLRQSEQKFRALYDNAPLSYQSLDEEGRFVDVNPTWLTTLGYDRDAVIGKYYADFLHPDWKSHFEENFPAFKQRGYVHDVEFKIRHHDGHYLDISFEGCIGHKLDGSFQQTYCVFQDITESKQALAQLAESERDYRSLFNNAHDAIILFKPENEMVVEANQRAFDLYGYTREEFIGMSLSNISTDIPLGEKRVKAVQEDGLIQQFEISQKRKDGSLIQVEINASYINYGGSMVILSLNHDITARKHAEKVLLAEKLFSESLVSSLPGVFYLISEEGKFLRWNANFEQVTGRSAEEMVQISPVDLFDGADKQAIALAIQRVFTHGEVQVEGRFVAKDGKRTPYQFSGKKIIVDGAPCLVGLGVDITEREQAAAATQISEEKFRALFEQVGNFCMIADPNTESGVPIIIDANKAFLDALGYEKEELIGSSVITIFPAEERKKFKERLSTVMSGKPVFLESARLRKDGSTLDVAIHGQRIDIGGKPPLIFTTEYDISEQKKAEQVILRQQYLLNKSQEIGLMGSWELDVQNDILVWTDENCRIFGVPEGTVGNFKMFIDRVHPDDREYVNQKWAEAMTGEPYDLEHRLLLDNVEKWVREKAEIEFDNTGAAIHAIGFTQDITAMKIAEQQLQGSEARYKDLFSNMAEGFALCEIILDDAGKPYDYRHLSVNDAYTVQTGIPTKTVLGKTVREFFPDVEDVWIQNYGEVALTGRSKNFVSYSKDTQKYFDVRAFSPSKGFFALLVWDISKAYYAEMELRRSEEFNRSITQTAPYAIISIDDEGCILSWNKEAETLFGYNESKMIGETLERIVSAQHKAAHASWVKGLSAGGLETLVGETLEATALRRGGKEFPIELGLSAWTSGDKRCFTAIIRDISTRKRIDAELKAAVQHAERANKVKDQFIANISHEIRTPLNSILGFSDLFKQKYSGIVDEKDAAIFGYISNSSNRLMSTVDAILNISQLSAGTITIRTSPET